MGSGKGRTRRAQSVTAPLSIAVLSAEGRRRCKNGKYESYYGPSNAFESLVGEEVIIPAGVPVLSDNPRRKGWRQQKTQRTMKVEDMCNGGTGSTIEGDATVWGYDDKNYWCYVPADLVIPPQHLAGTLPSFKPQIKRNPADMIILEPATVTF